ncbi:MAG TPA: allophanate hydrolase, partial [Egibacteraceae bacterium]|nr:allophanate hydrolase [Egibacteraceae bacterium]
VPLALGTDTAGSGRVPAAMNGIAGWKPTRGIVSATGVVPACRSLDCVSVFAGTAADLRAAVDVLARHDPDDAHARTGAETLGPAAAVAGLRVGVPDLAGLDVDAGTRASLGEAVRRLSGLGVEITPVDLSGVLEAGRLLYHGPWLAERLEAAGELMERDDGALLDVTRRVLAAGREYRAVDVFRAQTRVRVHAAACERLWRAVDILVVPSVPAAFTLAEVAADPIGVNERLGTFTNFVNLLDLAAVAMPVGLRADGVPAGVTLVGPALTDLTLLAVARAFAGGDGMPEPRPDGIPLAVVGAHLRGQPLHHELRDAGAHFLQRTRTAPRYRLYALSGTAPPKPGMVEVHADGAALEVEVYTLAADAFGRFVAGVRSPLYIGPVELADGRVVSGFRCGTEATAGSTDITRFGGWRAYLAAR